MGSHSGQFGRVWADGGLVVHRGGRRPAPACTLSATTKQMDVFNQPVDTECDQYSEKSIYLLFYTHDGTISIFNVFF